MADYASSSYYPSSQDGGVKSDDHQQADYSNVNYDPGPNASYYDSNQLQGADYQGAYPAYNNYSYSNNTPIDGSYDYQSKGYPQQQVQQYYDEGQSYQEPKQPNPKRPKTGYIIFSAEMRSKFKQDLDIEMKGHFRSQDIIRRSGEVWRSMSEEERRVWNEKGQEERARYEAECVAMGLRPEGGKKVYSRQKQKPGPRMPKSSYIIFSTEMRDSIKAQMPPDCTAQDVIKRTGELWRQMSKAERAPWEEKGKQEKDRYTRECEAVGIRYQPVTAQKAQSYRQNASRLYQQNHHSIGQPQVQYGHQPQQHHLQQDHGQYVQQYQQPSHQLHHQQPQHTHHQYQPQAQSQLGYPLPPPAPGPSATPAPPRALRSGYMLFASEVREQVKADLDLELRGQAQAKSQDVVKRTGELWRRLGEGGRQAWNERAKADLRRYEEEGEPLLGAHPPPQPAAQPRGNGGGGGGGYHHHQHQLGAGGPGGRGHHLAAAGGYHHPPGHGHGHGHYPGNGGHPHPAPAPLPPPRPDAPKPPRNSYIIFSTEMRDTIMAQLPAGSTVQDCIKRTGEIWRAMTPAQKQVYADRMRADKERYHKELAAAGLELPGAASRGGAAARDPNMPRRGMSAFLHFSKAMRPKVYAQQPNLRSADVSKMLAEQWRLLSDEEKAPFQRRADADCQKYRTEMAAYQAKREAQAQQQQQQQPAHTAAATQHALHAPAEMGPAPPAAQPSQQQQQAAAAHARALQDELDGVPPPGPGYPLEHPAGRPGEAAPAVPAEQGGAAPGPGGVGGAPRYHRGGGPAPLPAPPAAPGRTHEGARAAGGAGGTPPAIGEPAGVAGGGLGAGLLGAMAQEGGAGGGAGAGGPSDGVGGPMGHHHLSLAQAFQPVGETMVGGEEPEVSGLVAEATGADPAMLEQQAAVPLVGGGAVGGVGGGLPVGTAPSIGLPEGSAAR